MKLTIEPKRALFMRNPMLYGHFLEHFHRQIYGGVYDPASPLSDEDGFRMDVLKALRRIKTPVIRWPGGCFVSSYHWEKGVGPVRVPSFDKAWRVEDSNAFGTDEFIKLCRKLDCEPYICTNAGTGDAEEMSDWMEYCNLESQGEYARRRIANGHPEPYHVKYWSIGNENYGKWEIGAKESAEWSRLVTEAAKMMMHVDPSAELSAAALPDIDWNVALLRSAGERLNWISIHGYWDPIWTTNALADYDHCMGYTRNLDDSIQKVRGLLTAFGLEKKIKIAFDEWNLRGWYHPNAHTVQQPVDKALYLTPRDDNDLNASYTMADAVFSACFLNALLRNADIVGMANFAPVVNTRGAIFTHEKGIVLRTTYHVFDLYVNKLGETVLDSWLDACEPYKAQGKDGPVDVDCVDLVATRRSADAAVVVAAVNKHAQESRSVAFKIDGFAGGVRVTTLGGGSTDDYNDVGLENRIVPFENNQAAHLAPEGAAVTLPAHSVNIIEFLPGA